MTNFKIRYEYEDNKIVSAKFTFTNTLMSTTNVDVTVVNVFGQVGEHATVLFETDRSELITILPTFTGEYFPIAESEAEMKYLCKEIYMHLECCPLLDGSMSIDDLY